MKRLSLSVLFLLLWVATAWSQGTYFQALFHDSRARRLADFPKLEAVPFKRLGSQFTPADGDKGQILDLCQKAGMKVLYETNTGTQADHKKNFDAYPAIDYQGRRFDCRLAAVHARRYADVSHVQQDGRPGGLEEHRRRGGVATLHLQGGLIAAGLGDPQGLADGPYR
jgi:hypothetical protein